MKHTATVAIALVGVLVATPALAGGGGSKAPSWSVPTTHVHYCNCGDAIGKAMCASSSSSSSTSSGSTTSSTSGGATTSSTTSSTSGGSLQGSTTGGTAVPEPGMLGIMGLGFIGIAATRRRRR